MTDRLLTKMLLGFGILVILGGIVAAGLYNYQLLQSMQPEASARTAVPAETQSMTGPTEMTTARPIVIDPDNDPLAPVKHAQAAPVPRREKAPGLSKTYEAPLKSPVLVQ